MFIDDFISDIFDKKAIELPFIVTRYYDDYSDYVDVDVIEHLHEEYEIINNVDCMLIDSYDSSIREDVIEFLNAPYHFLKK